MQGARAKSRRPLQTLQADVSNFVCPISGVIEANLSVSRILTDVDTTCRCGDAADGNAPALFLRVDHFPPGMVRIERSHARTDPLGPWTEILFVDVAVIVDDEGHDAGVAILGGKGDEAEATNHVAAHDVVHRAARRILALAGQDPEVVAVIRLAGDETIRPLGRGSDPSPRRPLRRGP